MSETRLKKILDCLPEMQYVVNREGTLKYIKPAKDSKGYFDPVTSLGKNIYTLLPPAISLLIESKVKEVFDSGSEANCRYSLQLHEQSTEMHFEAHLDLLDEKEVLISVRNITAQVIAERELYESEVRYRRLFEENPVPMFIYDMKTLKILAANSTMVQSYGFTADELTSMTVNEIRVQEKKKFTGKKTGEGRDGLAFLRRERHRRGDGSTVDVDVSSRVIPVKDCEAVLLVCSDVTEKMQFDRTLEVKEEQYRHLFEQNPLPMLILDTKTLRYLDVNDAAVSHYGYSREEFRAMTAKDIRPPEDVMKTIKSIKSTQPEQNSVGIWRHRKKDGSLIFVDINTYLTQYDGREARIALINDVTERFAAQKALAESEEKFRSVVESSPMGVHLFKLEKQRLIFIEANRAADRILGIDHSKYKGQELEKVFPNLAGTEVPLKYREAASKGVPWYAEQVSYNDGNTPGMYEIVAFGTGNGTMAAMFLDITERKKAEEALVESEEKFRTAFYTSPDAIAISRVEDGAFLEINQGFLELTGYTRDEVLGKSAIELGIWPSTGKLTEFIKRHQTEGKVKDLKLLLEMKDGSIRETQVSTGTIQLEGRPHLLTVARDVTEFKRAQRELEVSEDKFRTAFMTSPDGVSISRLKDGLYIDVNESFLRATGYTREEIVGKTSFDINIWIEPGDRERLVSALMEKGSIQNMEMRYRMKDGRCLDTLTSARIMDLGGIPHFISIVRDYTQIKRAQNILKESEERFRAVFDTSPDTIIIIDAETKKITHVNNGFVISTGYTKEEVLGRTTEELEIWEDPEGREHFYRIFGKTGAVDGLECNFRYKDGTVSKALISARPMEWMDRLHILVIVRDITSIVETRNKLQTSLMEKEILLKEVHHRVKNNLQVISGLLNLQALHMGDEQGKITYRESQNRVHTMALIHEELYQSENLSQVDFSDYLGHLCNNVFSSYGVSMQQVRCDLDIQQKEVVVDTAIPCGLIVNELVSNALKHAFPNGRKGVVQVFFRRLESGRFQLTVSDNGIGIPEDIDIRKSISLGLQLVSVLVEQLGGRLEVENKEGTTFRMTLKEYHEAGTMLY